MRVLSGGPAPPSLMQKSGSCPSFPAPCVNPQFLGAEPPHPALNPHPHLQDRKGKALAVWGSLLLGHSRACRVLALESLRQLCVYGREGAGVRKPLSLLDSDRDNLSTASEAVTETSPSMEVLKLRFSPEQKSRGFQRHHTLCAEDSYQINVPKT